MRKISVFLVLALVLTMCPPLFASASEVPNEPLSRDELVALACSVFPEYADNISSPRTPIVQSRSSYDPVVVNETRKISDSEVMTYQELASGIAYTLFTKSWDVTSSSTSGNTKSVTGSLSVNCNISANVFYISNLKYKIVTNGYDSITSKGNRSTFTTCPTVLVSGEKLNENASGPAYLQYEAVFSPFDYSATTSCTCRITVTLGNDTFSTSAVG